MRAARSIVLSLALAATLGAGAARAQSSGQPDEALFRAIYKELVGINTTTVMAVAFGGSAAIGAIGGILVTPITLTSYDVGTMLALKGFAAAMLGGMGNPLGAVAGGLLLGLLEAFGAGYISSTYKDGFSFIVILVVLVAMPQGLFGRRSVERV